jgi:hypothetical protein
MITLQNISTSSRIISFKHGITTIIKQADSHRFIHLTEEEYALATKNGTEPLTGIEVEDNTSYIWKWTDPVTDWGLPIVPPPQESDPPLPIPLPSTLRPSPVVLGQMWFDRILQRPIWWNGTHWLDFVGGKTIRGTLTVSGIGEITIPCSGQPIETEALFIDEQIWSGCGPQIDDIVTIEITEDLSCLHIVWDIKSNSRQVAWSAHLACIV